MVRRIQKKEKYNGIRKSNCLSCSSRYCPVLSCPIVPLSHCPFKQVLSCPRYCRPIQAGIVVLFKQVLSCIVMSHCPFKQVLQILSCSSRYYRIPLSVQADIVLSHCPFKQILSCSSRYLGFPFQAKILLGLPLKI